MLLVPLNAAIFEPFRYTLNVAFAIPDHDKIVPESDTLVGGAVVITVIGTDVDTAPLKVVDNTYFIETPGFAYPFRIPIVENRFDEDDEPLASTSEYIAFVSPDHVSQLDTFCVTLRMRLFVVSPT